MKKETFIKILQKIKVQDEIDNDLGRSLMRISDSHITFNSRNLKYDALIDLMQEVMEDKDDFISWWLYEDVSKVVTEKDGTEIDLTDPGDLWEFLMEGKFDKEMLITDEWIADVLNKLPFVRWDRYVTSPEQTRYYGWIERDDGKSDFIIIGVKPTYYYMMTSSAKRDSEIKKILGMKDDLSKSCKRIEDLPWGNRVNCIKLKKKK